MELTRIVAIRHGETAWNTTGRIQGHTDIPLNKNGQWQASQMARTLEGAGIEAIYSSDLQRAWQTAQALQIATRITPVAMPELRERKFGIFEGHTFAEIEEINPEAARLWQRRDLHYAAQDGESLAQFRRRIVRGLNTLAQREVGKHIALVTHGGVLDILYRHANGLDLQAPRTWTIENASINRFLWTPDAFTLVGWADNAHLETGSSLDEKIV